jgi:hypothetical protein
VDEAAAGSFLSLNITEATTLIEKMASNQGWNEEHTQPHKRGGGMHQLKKVDMLCHTWFSNEQNQANHICAQEVHTYIRMKKYQKQCYYITYT